MNKQELVSAVADATGMTQAQSTKVLNAVLECVTSSLAKGEDVVLVNFGTFAVRNRLARNGRNPQTGAVIQLPATKVASFTAGKALKAAVNQ
ncbi:HU family DNA-binding protein [Pseudomonas sp. PS01301]|uniref:HU family DNA-binding protein n=1 Tax=Pseudomonas sp. PS01301 TaxID=2991437 RepID=UPI00249A2D62|nr:HU family DNA-binding protein [Pseudomonas sp. PS01301]